MMNRNGLYRNSFFTFELAFCTTVIQILQIFDRKKSYTSNVQEIGKTVFSPFLSRCQLFRDFVKPNRYLSFARAPLILGSSSIFMWDKC